MNCSFCHRDFDETELTEACQDCPSGGGCHQIRCPYCGYETPKEPGLIKHLKTMISGRRRRRNHE